MKPTKQNITNLYDLDNKTSTDMKLPSKPTGREAASIFSKIEREKKEAETKAAILSDFQTKLKDYSADDLVERDGIIGFDLSSKGELNA